MCMRIQVSRNLITTASFGSRVVDSYTILNNGSAPISAIDLYLPEEYEIHFLSMEAVDESGNTIQVIRQENEDGMMYWKLHFPEPIGFQTEYSFVTTMYMHTLFWLSIPSEFEYQIRFLKYPVLSYVLTNAEFTIRAINQQDFLNTIKDIKPVVSDDELIKFKEWTDEFGG